MDTATFDAITGAVRSVIELGGALGLGKVALTYLNAQGINTQNLQNNKLVQAAENAAEAGITDILIQGKSPMDPAVLNDVIASIRTSLTQTHAQTIAGAGAAPVDVARVVSNAVMKVARNAPVPTAAPVAPPDDIANAVQKIVQARSALGNLMAQQEPNPPVPYISNPEPLRTGVDATGTGSAPQTAAMLVAAGAPA